MTVILPQTVNVTDVTCQVQTHTLETEIDSHLLDGFLESCTGTAPTHLIPANSVPSRISNSTILALPLNTMKRILRYLLRSPHPLILEHDSVSTSQQNRTYVNPNILQVCKAFHNIGVPILYGENTLTTSSPSTSFDFDKHLFSLPGRKRQLVTDIKLEIDWGDQLWSKFPLVARALGELKRLWKLEIVIIERDQMGERNRSAMIGQDASLDIVITYDNPVPLENVNSACQRPSTTNGADRRVAREGAVADAMLQAEMKTLKDLVTGFKGLKHFKLIGFRYQAFAWRLEEHVRMGNR